MSQPTFPLRCGSDHVFNDHQCHWDPNYTVTDNNSHRSHWNNQITTAGSLRQSVSCCYFNLCLHHLCWRQNSWYIQSDQGKCHWNSHIRTAGSLRQGVTCHATSASPIQDWLLEVKPVMLKLQCPLLHHPCCWWQKLWYTESDQGKSHWDNQIRTPGSWSRKRVLLQRQLL